MYKNLCSIPNRFWESECSKLCSHNYMFLGSGTDLGDSSYVKNVTLLKYWWDLQLIFYYLKISNFLWRKNAAYYTPIGVYTPIGTFIQPVKALARLVSVKPSPYLLFGHVLPFPMVKREFAYWRQRKSIINKSGEFEQIILFHVSVYLSKDIFYQNVNRDG